MTQRSLRPTGFKGEPTKIPDIPTQELRDRLRRLAGVLEDTTATEIQRRIIQSLAQVPYAPIRVETDVPRSVMNYVQERQTLFPERDRRAGLPAPVPAHDARAQMLGTVGEIQLQAAQAEALPRRQAGHRRGQGGLEYQYDRYLRGTDGSQRDPGRRPRATRRASFAEARAEGRTAPQAVARPRAAARAGQEALTGQGNPGGQPAAFVAMNPDNGEILGMGSSRPSTQPATKPITQERYDALFGEQAGSPLFNRATTACTPTGRRSRSSRRSRAARAARSRRPRASRTTAASRSATASSATRKASPTARSTCSRRSRSPPTSTSTSWARTWTRRRASRSRSTPRELGFGHDTGIDLPARPTASSPTVRGASSSARRS